MEHANAHNILNQHHPSVSIFFLFYDSVKCVEEAFKISGRLYGPQVALGHGNYIKYKNLEFRVEHRIRWFGQTGKRAGAQLEIKLMSNSLSIGSVRELIQFLFEREVLFITD